MKYYRKAPKYKIKVSKTRRKNPVLNIESIIHYNRYLSQVLKEPGFQFDLVCIQQNPLVSSDKIVTVFDSFMNFQFVLRKLKNSIALEMRGMIL